MSFKYFMMHHVSEERSANCACVAMCKYVKFRCINVGKALRAL